MIVVKVELWSAQSGRVRELFRMALANDGSLGNGKRGSYDVSLFRHTKDHLLRRGHLRKGRVEDFPRHSYHVGRLVLRALKACFPEEKQA